MGSMVTLFDGVIDASAGSSIAIAISIAETFSMVSGTPACGRGLGLGWVGLGWRSSATAMPLTIWLSTQPLSSDLMTAVAGTPTRSRCPSVPLRVKGSSESPGRSNQRRFGPLIDLASKVGGLLHAHESEAVAFELPFMLADRFFDSTEFARLH